MVIHRVKVVRFYFAGMLQDLKAIAATQRVSVGSACKAVKPQCADYMCAGVGECTEGWNRPVCDCTNSMYSGDRCQNGKQT